MKFKSDIDIDFGDRTRALELLNCTPASIMRDGRLVRHNTGVYPTDIPTDPFLGIASIDYESAEDLGYAKLDFLNVSLYTQIKSEQHLTELMSQEPVWDLLLDAEFCSQLIHVGNHHDLLMRCPEPVDSIPRMAMFLALIRPGKRHLVGRTWQEVAKTIWDITEEGYTFKKSHAVAYAHLVAVHMNLICELICSASTDLTNQGN
jgi:hypothetical protein